jgi:hypothetical protein
MFINTSSECPEGTVLKLRFRLSRSSYLMEARSEGRYHLRRADIGVEFIGMAPEADQTIEKELSYGD